MTAKKKSTNRIIKATPKVSATEGADDLEILNPNRKLTIAGKAITVREYGFIEGLEVRAQAKPFLNDLYEFVMADTVCVEQALDFVAKHRETILPLIAKSADVDMEFVRKLSPSDGHSLIYVWWSVNGPFFIACVHDRIVGEVKEQSAKRARAG